jgi:hypothetical protein
MAGELRPIFDRPMPEPRPRCLTDQAISIDRVEAGTSPRDDMDAFLDPLLSFAQRRLDKSGEFFPFGATISSDGQLELAAAATDSEHPPSQELIDLMEEGFSQAASRGEIRASAICLDVILRPPSAEPTDAIEIRIEHRDADPVKVHLPYTKRRFRGIDYGELSASLGETRVFPR